MKPIRIAISGTGNLAQGVQKSILSQPDLELVALFTRRPDQPFLKTWNVSIYHQEELDKTSVEIDVVILCGSSAYDLPHQTASCASYHCFVDSFDVHTHAEKHITTLDTKAKQAQTSGIVCAGWDPGLFSMTRCLSEAFLPNGQTSTFWGKGVSQGHSAAIRGIKGVIDAIQYTVPTEDAIEQARKANAPYIPQTKQHHRICYVVAENNADKEKITTEIQQMPGYFQGYETQVHFVSQDQLAEYRTFAHAGRVIRAGTTSPEHSHCLELSASLSSNPEFTANILCACARAAVRCFQNQQYGCFSMLDIPPAYFHASDKQTLYHQLL